MATRPSEVNPVKTEDAPAYWSQGILWTILATADQTGGSYSLMEEICSLNSGPQPHTHERDDRQLFDDYGKGGLPCLYSCALRPQLSRRRR
jgi:hypothetical protein